jgi:curved DNA-binding protein
MGGGGHAGVGGFEEFIGKMGGHRSGPGRRRSSRPAKAQDIEHTVRLSFMQAVTGTSLDLRITEPGTGGGKTISVKIPAGVSDGQKIRLRGKGQPGGHGMQAGDLYIICKIEPHPYFRREGNDILLEVPLTITEATLGAKIEIPTLDGKTMLTIPPGTSSGAKLRLKAKGIQPAGDHPRGDQYVIVKIVAPRSLTPEQQELMRELDAALDDSPRCDLGW